MMAVWRKLRERAEFADTFVMGCDSHGLQLLIGDLLKLGNIKTTFQKAQGIVNHFNSSPLQLATLRKIQQSINRAEFSLIGAVITRWGSQYRMLSSVLRSQYALMMFADEASDLKVELQETLRNSDFWTNLKKLIAILKPINEAISMSEDVKSDIGKVINRWRNIEIHLRSYMDSEFSIEINTFLTSGFPSRINRQFEDIHWAAFYLDPANRNTSLEGRLQELVHQAVRRYCKEDPDEAIRQFSAFRGGDGVFYEASCWKYKNEPKAFWQVQVDIQKLSYVSHLLTIYHRKQVLSLLKSYLALLSAFFILRQHLSPQSVLSPL